LTNTALLTQLAVAGERRAAERQPPDTVDQSISPARGAAGSKLAPL